MKGSDRSTQGSERSTKGREQITEGKEQPGSEQPPQCKALFLLTSEPKELGHSGLENSTYARAGWIRALILESLRDTVQLPGPKSSALRAGWVSTLLLAWLRTQWNHPAQGHLSGMAVEAV